LDRAVFHILHDDVRRAIPREVYDAEVGRSEG
jgi:hypothetical protein